MEIKNKKIINFFNEHKNLDMEKTILKFIEIMENFVFVDKKISIKYEDVKEVYRKLVAEDYVDYDKYKTLRDIFEKLRYSRIIIGQ